MYIPKYFKPYELVPETIYNQFMDGGQLSLNFWNLFDSRMLITADRLRGYFGKMIANTWWWGGKTQYRGFRPPDTLEGSKWSQHRFGRALDSVFEGVETEEVIKVILNNPFTPQFEYINAIELNVGWLHFDTRNWNKEENGIFTLPNERG